MIFGHTRAGRRPRAGEYACPCHPSSTRQTGMQMNNRPHALDCGKILLIVVALGCAFASPAFAQPIPPATRPAVAVTQPATAPTTRPNGNLHGITTQPGGGLKLNFKEASIESVLDELSQAAGFIIIKDVDKKIEGRITLTSTGQVVRPDEAI